MSSTSSAGRPANSAGSANVISTERSPRRVLRATAGCAPSRAARSPTQACDSSSGPTTTVLGSKPPARKPSAIAGMADKLSASMPGKHRVNVFGAMQMGVDGDDPVHRARQQPADDLLADRFAFVERRILPHVAEIGRHQHEPLARRRAATLPPRTAAPAACRWAGRARHRRSSSPPPVPRSRAVRHPGNRCSAISCSGTPSRAASRAAVAGRRRQALHGDRGHGLISPPSARSTT